MGREEKEEREREREEKGEASPYREGTATAVGWVVHGWQINASTISWLSTPKCNGCLKVNIILNIEIEITSEKHAAWITATGL